MISGAYNNNLQILQVPGYVVILNEMIHNTRIIPTDGRPHGRIPQWAGDSRGRWEGNTLIVETINFLRETSLIGSTADTKLVERFTRVGADTINYEATIDDPGAYTKSWTVAWDIPWNATGELQEYICQENNNYFNRLTDDFGQPILGPRQ